VWDHQARLQLRFSSPCLVRRAIDSALNERQKWVLEALERRERVSNRDLRAALAVPRATAQRDLDHLVSLGLVRREGRGRATTYRRP
jgi:DeoR/GlpR family transcriptional regulator of sugar metabolism